MEFDFLFSGGEAETCGPETFAGDLRLDILLGAMAAGDGRTADACRRVLLHPLTRAEAIAARRAVLADACAHPAMFEEWLAAARAALKGADRFAEFQNPRYDRIISNQKKLITETEVARIYLKGLRGIHASLQKTPGPFASGAVRRFAADVRLRYGEGNLALMEKRLDALDGLKLSDELTLSAAVGEGLKPAGTVLNGLAHHTAGRRRHGAEKEITIPLANVALVQNAEDIVQNAVLPLYRAAAGFTKDCRKFFEKLSLQMGFYTGCVRLQKTLEALGVPLCVPEIVEGGAITGAGVADPGLALLQKAAPVGNDVCFTGKRLVLVTGVNQGGKTTFLRGVGLAQLMAQCGMFVAARRYACPVYGGIYTHFPSGEDAAHGMGLLDVELCKLSRIVDAIGPRGLLLMNESFQTTMPPDAGYLAETAVKAFMDSGVTVVFVTHLYTYASALYAGHPEDVLFLRARRGAGSDAFRIAEGEPYVSASGNDLLREVLGQR